MATVYTANTRAVYRAGAYDGTHTLGQLRRHGTFGLGALDHNEGEFVMLDGRGWAVRIDGVFGYVEAGAGAWQPAPYRSLAEVFGEYNWIRHEPTTGTLVGLAMPECFASIDVPGFHFHWLSEDRLQGGHVIDYAAEGVSTEACETTTFVFDIGSRHRSM
ncbi:MAG: acetolactate decarboxylase [Microlunatus sp.]|nr:acetolactate decarboxylase [Microlunatus sp.]